MYGDQTDFFLQNLHRIALQLDTKSGQSLKKEKEKKRGLVDPCLLLLLASHKFYLFLM